ncbi:FKBP-type peptidyl-prolyl cis-trans isomerase [uncultured Maribacter sp.]|uniref:FKBP-type peptidyl-prolyl cis-trans isomerase n=1 Tax=uncultured Maribacter sp. TaxID=431308 RepID=UPI0026095A44|nr:FKBP-type peptidyl-prolyl cis-trans isomerase [uncultured Maribacter sp.]
MKKVFVLYIAIALFYSCKQEEKEEFRNIILGDTICTPSGLKYIFLKEGNGRPIHLKSKVEAYMDLYINESDSIYWSTSTEEDSIFRFIHGVTFMIKGFEELNNYLIEGDEVTAILPDSIAYGREGGNGMPAAATLIYNPLIIKKVSKPKRLISDTLQIIITKEGSQAAIDFYSKTINSDLKEEFHTDTELIFNLLDSLMVKEFYQETEKLSQYFEKTNNNDFELQTFAYYEMLGLEEQGKVNDAMLIVDEQLNRESHWEWWNDKKTN